MLLQQNMANSGTQFNPNSNLNPYQQILLQQNSQQGGGGGSMMPTYRDPNNLANTLGRIPSYPAPGPAVWERPSNSSGWESPYTY